MNESEWIMFWQTVLGIGLGSYVLMALIIIPFGARDVLKLFCKLDANDQRDR